MRDILSEYESPILNDVLFLSNYMMTSFNTKSTPLMKMLTGMELLLEKLDVMAVKPNVGIAFSVSVPSPCCTVMP